MIDDSQRMRIGELAAKALDMIEEEYGEEATLGDAVLCFEILGPDPNDLGGEPGFCESRWVSTTKRLAPTVGVIEMSKAGMLAFERMNEDEEEDDE